MMKAYNYGTSFLISLSSFCAKEMITWTKKAEWNFKQIQLQ